MKLSKSQLNVVKASSSTRQLVIAGPGTGKTHCLIERLKYLYTKEDLNPATEILVLTFSVAAINEIKNRLDSAVEAGECDDLLLYSNIRTFDSFASHFMLRLDPDIELGGTDYDGRIQMAAEIISENESAKQMLYRYRHVLVDEIQDLVGVRATLTQRILTNIPGGITLFGDPAQGIYDYLMKKDSAEPTSDEFLIWTKRNFDDLIIRNDMALNYRVGSSKDLEQIAIEGRKQLFEMKPLPAFNRLYDLFCGLTELGRLNDPQIPLDYLNSNTAVLCRTNGQVLCLARNLYENGINFCIRRRHEERIIPPWVGRILCGWNGSSIQKSQFLDLYSEKWVSPHLTSDEAWETLKESEGGRIKNSIDIYNLRHALLHETIFIKPLNSEIDAEDIILSTIHRSKGREIDHVIVVIQNALIADEDEARQEARTLYVALTRAKNRIFRMSEKGSRGIIKIESQERWVRAIGKGFTGIEIGLEGDIDPHSFVSMEIHENDIQDIRDNQHDLWTNVRPSMQAELSLYKFDGGLPKYLVKAEIDDNFVIVGATSEKFGRSLKNCIEEIKQRSISKKDFPNKIDHLWVKEVVTEIGDLGHKDVPREFRSTGMWLGIRLEGLGQCHW